MKKYFKAFIRVVKTIDVETRGDDMEHYNIIREPLIKACDKKEVKEILLNKYPQFFQKNKVYEKGTKDPAQFFYVVIFELYNHEIEEIKKGAITKEDAQILMEGMQKVNINVGGVRVKQDGYNCSFGGRAGHSQL